MTDSTSGAGSHDGLTPADHLGGVLPSSPPMTPVEGSPESPFDPPATYKRRLTADGMQEFDPDAGEEEDPGPTPLQMLQNSKRKKWLIGGGVLAMLAIATALALSVGASSAPLLTARDFMNHLDNGEYTKALELTDPECIGGANEAALANIFKGADLDFSLTRTEVNATGGTLVDGTVTVDGLGQQPLNLTLRKIDGDWKVCSIG